VSAAVLQDYAAARLASVETQKRIVVLCVAAFNSAGHHVGTDIVMQSAARHAHPACLIVEIAAFNSVAMAKSGLASV
jgi:hypothetical protein